MKRKFLQNKLWMALVMGLLLLLPCVNASAEGRFREGRHEVVIVGHERYHYRDGRFYRPSWFGFSLSVVTAPIGAVITTLPVGYRTIVVSGVPYYHYNNIYYRVCPRGYVVVRQPAAGPQGFSQEAVTINVPNAAGGYTPVTLVKRGAGYIGPQGEYYQGNPTVDQLRALYGR